MVGRRQDTIVFGKDGDVEPLSWDAASWHDGKQFNDRLTEVNSPEYRAIHHTPHVELAPLPSRANNCKDPIWCSMQ
jgi:hypothetical protein